MGIGLNESWLGHQYIVYYKSVRMALDNKKVNTAYLICMFKFAPIVLRLANAGTQVGRDFWLETMGSLLKTR